MKKARDEFQEAQKKYVSAMQAAMGAKTEVKVQKTEGSSQPAGSGTDGVRKTK
ncbi:MAG: hypothetical protein HZA88_14335 [Verrucomicrobia bacterium]|nr:hypothetical protein [Verrucomicrobiota bacterium]